MIDEQNRVDAGRDRGRLEERAKVVAYLRRVAAQLQTEARRIPLGDAVRGGLFNGGIEFANHRKEAP